MKQEDSASAKDKTKRITGLDEGLSTFERRVPRGFGSGYSSGAPSVFVLLFHPDIVVFRLQL